MTPGIDDKKETKDEVKATETEKSVADSQMDSTDDPSLEDAGIPVASEDDECRSVGVGEPAGVRSDALGCAGHVCLAPGLAAIQAKVHCLFETTEAAHHG